MASSRSLERRAWVAGLAASPSLRRAGSEAREKGASWRSSAVASGAEVRSSVASGPPWRASAESWAMLGRSSARKAGRRRVAWRRPSRRDAAVSAAPRDSWMKSVTSWLRASSRETTVSASVMNCLIVWFWLPRIASVRRVSRSPGQERRSTACTSWGRPARPVPSVAMNRRRRSRAGRRSTSSTRSWGIVPASLASGTVPPSASTWREEPGWQSTKYSPTSDWGRIVQRASRRSGGVPLRLTFTVTIALGGPVREVLMENFVVWPARTPPTRKSPPSTRPKALSNTRW